MVRVTNGKQRQRRHKRFRKRAKGLRLGRRTVYKQMRLALIRQGQNAYVGRKLKKRDFRRLWIERLSAATRMRGGKYSQFMHALSQNKIQLNRKMLSNIVVMFPEIFDVIYKKVA